MFARLFCVAIPVIEVTVQRRRKGFDYKLVFPTQKLGAAVNVRVRQALAFVRLPSHGVHVCKSHVC